MRIKGENAPTCRLLRYHGFRRLSTRRDAPTMAHYRIRAGSVFLPRFIRQVWRPMAAVCKSATTSSESPPYNHCTETSHRMCALVAFAIMNSIQQNITVADFWFIKECNVWHFCIKMVCGQWPSGYQEYYQPNTCAAWARYRTKNIWDNATVTHFTL